MKTWRDRQTHPVQKNILTDQSGSTINTITHSAHPRLKLFKVFHSAGGGSKETSSCPLQSGALPGCCCICADVPCCFSRDAPPPPLVSPIFLFLVQLHFLPFSSRTEQCGWKTHGNKCMNKTLKPQNKQCQQLWCCRPLYTPATEVEDNTHDCLGSAGQSHLKRLVCE